MKTIKKTEKVLDERTFQKRNEVRERLKTIVDKESDIEQILNSIEAFCELILHL